MKRLLFKIMCVTGLLALSAGCKEVEPDTQKAPEITLEQTEVSVAAEGGHFSVGYELLNPTNQATIKTNVQHDWVKNVEVEAESISFDVEASYEQPERSCRIELIYPGIYPNPTITIKQGVGKSHSIELDLISAAATTITLDVIPQNKTMPYVFILGNGTYIKESGLMTDDQALWQSDLDIFHSFADAFGGDVTLAAKAFMYEGDMMSYQFTGVTPDTDYVVYAYGFDNETLTPLTEISRLEVRTAKVEDYILHFDFNVEVDGPNVSIDVTPINYDGYFYFGVFWATDVPQGTSVERLRGYCEADWEQAKGVYAPFFDTPEEGLHFIFNELAYKGTAHLEAELDANTEFVLWAFGMDDEALMNTAPESYYFTTGRAHSSNNEFTLSVSDLCPRKATISVTTTNNDSYIASLQPSNRFEGMTDEQVIEYVLDKFSLNYITGSINDVVTDLTPSTEYELLVFGCQAGDATTSLKRLTFTTPQVVYADLDFSLCVDNYYDGSAVAALNPNYAPFEGLAIVNVEASVDDQAEEFYFAALEAQEYPYYDYETLIKALVAEGGAEASASYAFEFDMPYIFFGVAKDKEGNYTQMWESKQTTFTRVGCSPAEEFLDTAVGQAAARVSAIGSHQPQGTSPKANRLTQF